MSEQETPRQLVDNTADSLSHWAASLHSRASKGEEFTREEILVIAERMHEHAADLRLAASRLA